LDLAVEVSEQKRPIADLEKGFRMLWSQPTLPPFAQQSDVAPTPDIYAGYVSLLLDYLELIAAERARSST
jgi:hypothetical protein